MRDAHQVLVDRRGRLRGLRGWPRRPATGRGACRRRRTRRRRSSCSRSLHFTLPRGSSSRPKLLDRAAASRARRSPSPTAPAGRARPFRCRALRGTSAGPASSLIHSIVDGAQALHVARVVAQEFLGLDAELPVAAFLVRGAGAEDHRPIGPGRVGRPLARRGETGPRRAAAANSSNCVRLAQPCRFDVPVQSLPVSPPPMTITSLPVARI